MSKKTFVVTGLLLLLSLSSCGSNAIRMDSDDYVKTIDSYQDGFKILQLTDIHWNYTTDFAKQSEYLTAIVKLAKPNLIMVTGDSTLNANKEIADKLYDLIDSWKIPYGITWGNHDRQGTWNPTWISERASKGTYSLYDEVEDSVTGRSNYVINLRKNNELKWQIYSLDSNSYAYDGGIKYHYDYIHDDQVDWYSAQAEKAKDEKGSYVPSVFYFHIPLWQWYHAYKSTAETKGLGEIHENATYVVEGLNDDDPMPFWPGSQSSKLFSTATKKNAKAFYCGHDHSNDWGELYTEDGGTAYIGYGVKSGRELYNGVSDAGYDITGGAVMTLHDDGSYDLEHLYVNTDDYADVHSVSISVSKEGK